MRSIEVGNIVVHNSNAVCVIFKIDSNDDNSTYYGIDSSSNIHKGSLNDWKNILSDKKGLHSFEDSIVNNIIAGRGL